MARGWSGWRGLGAWKKLLFCRAYSGKGRILIAVVLVIHLSLSSIGTYCQIGVYESIKRALVSLFLLYFFLHSVFGAIFNFFTYFVILCNKILDFIIFVV